MREFEIALQQLNECCIENDFKFNNYIEEQNALNEDFAKVRESIADTVQSFFDFLTGAYVSLLAKLSTIPNFKNMVPNLKKKGKDAKKTVEKYWNELKATKGEEGTGKFAKLKTKINDVIAKFRKMCDDLRKKIKDTKDKAKKEIKHTTKFGAAVRADTYYAKAAEADKRYDNIKTNQDEFLNYANKRLVKKVKKTKED